MASGRQTHQHGGRSIECHLGPIDPATAQHASKIDGKTTEIPDERHSGQRLHDALEDACGRLLQAGGSAASVAPQHR